MGIHFNGMPRTYWQSNTILVVVDNFSKATPFVVIKSIYKACDIALIFMKGIFRLHVVPNNIILYRDAKFTSTFWKQLFDGFGTKLTFNTTYHP